MPRTDAAGAAPSGPRRNRFEAMDRYTSLLEPADHAILGRERLVRTLLATFERPLVSNALLLAEAGTGKTALVQELARQDPGRIYRSVDVPAMIADSANPREDLAPRLKSVFDETRTFNRMAGRPVVLFIDEFHQIVQLSPAAVEALKPLLAQSASHGVRIIAATTLVEYHDYVAPNLPLVERLQRINVPPPPRPVVIDILMSIAKGQRAPLSRGLAGTVYDYAERYMPASAQPRKSIMLLDSMIGWHRLDGDGGGAPMDEALLARVLEQNANVSVRLKASPDAVKRRINGRVMAQQWAAEAIDQRLQICLAGLNDPGRPMASFLFAGSTGVGKTEVVKQMTVGLFGEDMRHLVRFDMSEYSLDGSVDRFRVALADYVWNMPYCVILLDEMDKAAPNVVQLLLQVLDDGRLTDANGRTVTFTNAYVVMTTNAGVGSGIFSSMAAYAPSDSGAGEQLRDWMDSIRKALTGRPGEQGGFPPEFLGRIDTIVPFQPLSNATMHAIASRRLSEQRDLLRAKQGADLRWTDRVVDYVAEERAPGEADVNAGGARYIMSVIESEIMSPVARLANAHPECRLVSIDVEGTMRVDRGSVHRRGDARIRATAFDGDGRPLGDGAGAAPAAVAPVPEGGAQAGRPRTLQ